MLYYYLRMVYLLMLVGTVMTGCNKCIDGCDVADTVVEYRSPDMVSFLVEQENAYRTMLGQSPLTSGLVCTLYTVPNGSSGITGTTLTSVASYTMVGGFNQPNVSASEGLNILPPALRSVYTSWFVVRCTGKIVIEQSNYYKFDLVSDDGSMLYLDGSLLINNDGNHGATLKSGTKMMRQGLHDFRLDYMQGPAGNQALSLLMQNSVVSHEFYH